MANFTPIFGTGLQINQRVTSAQLNALDADHVNSLNRTGGDIVGPINVLSTILTLNNSTLDLISGSTIGLGTGTALSSAVGSFVVLAGSVQLTGLNAISGTTSIAGTIEVTGLPTFTNAITITNTGSLTSSGPIVTTGPNELNGLTVLAGTNTISGVNTLLGTVTVGDGSTIMNVSFLNNTSTAFVSGSAVTFGGTTNFVTPLYADDGILAGAGNAVSFGVTSVAMNLVGSTVIGSSQYNNSIISFTASGPLTGTCNITFPNIVGAFWIIRLVGVNYTSNSVTIQINAGGVANPIVNSGVIVNGATGNTLIVFIPASGVINYV